MSLALFDLDNTLIAGDSDYLWGCFLAEQGIVDAESHERENQRFYQQYKAGELDIHEFLDFQFRPLAEHDMASLLALRERYIEEKIRPILLPAAQDLVRKHARQGNLPVIITATNSFITAPIAGLYGIEHLLATQPEQVDGQFTGRLAGTPCFREGKVTVLMQWLEQRDMDLAGSWFYSDSHNDLSLLERVSHPCAVDPDAILRSHAEQHHWPVISLRRTAD